MSKLNTQDTSSPGNGNCRQDKPINESANSQVQSKPWHNCVVPQECPCAIEDCPRYDRFLEKHEREQEEYYARVHEYEDQIIMEREEDEAMERGQYEAEKGIPFPDPSGWPQWKIDAYIAGRKTGNERKTGERKL